MSLLRNASSTTATRETTAGTASAAGGPTLARPLTPRSVIGSLLLGMHPPRLRAALLVRWCRHLGIAEGTTRVALSRMVEAGELTVSEARYELAGALRARQASQDWSLSPALLPWSGAWTLALVTTAPRDAAARGGLRSAARSARLVEVRGGVWGRPDNLPAEATPAAAATVLTAQTTRWSATPAPGQEPPAAALFDLASIAGRTRDLDAALRRITAALAAGDLDLLGDGFRLGATALQQIRRDPLLPAELAGDDWPGPALRTTYADFQQVFSASIGTWFGRSATSS